MVCSLWRDARADLDERLDPAPAGAAARGRTLRELMSSKQLELIAAVYVDDERARTIADMLEQMHRATTITMEDCAIVTKGPDGKLNITETREVTTGKGAKRGA